MSTKSKKRRFIAQRPRKSKFVEIFRATPSNTVCPNFYVLMHANGCGFEPLCSYCYLKSSLCHLNAHQVFTNCDKMLAECKKWITTDGLESYMLNSGNLADSLSLEQHRPVVTDLIKLFRDQAELKGRPHTLLLVTKGGMTEIKPLLKLKPCSNVIVSFSLNNPDAARRYESGAPSISSRLEAIRRLIKRGWRVRVRIDPMIVGFDYVPLAKEVKKIRPERITLGTLRAEHNLMRVLKSSLFRDLQKTSNKNALSRYPFGTRMNMYKKVIGALGKTASIGLCEETPNVWKKLELDHKAKTCNCA